jgi:methionyl-tRNA formyltransferase
MPSPSPRIVVFGYGEIGVACVEELLALGADVVAVVTHEDDPGETIWFSSVKDLARSRAIPVHTPANPNTEGFIDMITGYVPDLMYSFYYRRILSGQLLAIPTLGALNLHGSLLPKYRGRAPLNWALVNGERVTGVTLHYMDAWADHGDIVAQKSVAIAVDDTAASLAKKLTAAARRLLRDAHPLIASGRAPRVPQDHGAATTFGRRGPADGRIDWCRACWEVYNLIRAVTRPVPGAFTFLGERRMFLWAARPPRERSNSKDQERTRVRMYESTLARCNALGGTILGASDGALEVATGDGILEVLEIQAEGQREMDGVAFLARHPCGARFE